MNAITFDTLKYANTLKAAGFVPEQAEAQASALSDVLEVNLKELVTKADLAALEQRMDSRFSQLEQRMDSKFIELEQRMTIKLGAMMVVAIGVIAAIIKL